MLNSEASCREYLAVQDASTIASQIRHDQEVCKALRLPSILVDYLPPAGSELGDAIALELCSETAMYGKSITRAQYAGIVEGIKSYRNGMTHLQRHPELPTTEYKDQAPTQEAIQTTLSVLDFCLRSQRVKGINLRTPLEDIFLALNTQLQDPSPPKKSSEPPLTSSSHRRSQKKCYICQFRFFTPHPHYPSLCNPCGQFNLASSSLSLPSALSLKSRNALVTGGRLNLGYHTALRLLRCGARVIVSTRYPRDAESRYTHEKDFPIWRDSLRIVGADFRAAADVFSLVDIVKSQLRRWNDDGEIHLDILINNAAQTLTDPLEVERQAVRKEAQLEIEGRDATNHLQLSPSRYQAQIRGGVQSTQLLAFESEPEAVVESKSLMDAGHTPEINLPTGSSHNTSLMTAPNHGKSSWMQTLHQIPYEDVISAHSVNTFVPLILIRELLPLMGSLRTTPGPKKPLAYIINVSSREGIFESSPNSSSKQGHHVHTNLSKAALNMLTETEAGPAWRARRVAMNTVDPGYMSAAPEIEAHWKKQGREACPIGWEDGAGRVLWPIAVCERGECNPIWGRFLKHFGAVEVDVGMGR
jgi:NAD(P)-dependent dehydrogenase (short-subunit alcohol dehydrogenase family)